MPARRSVRARVTVFLVAAAAIAAGACNRNDDDANRARINVLDSTFTQSWQMMQDTGLVYRIEVISPAGADTIRDVIPPAPVVVGDTLVIGLVQASEDSSTPKRQFFRLRLGQHRIETTPLPGSAARSASLGGTQGRSADGWRERAQAEEGPNCP